MIDTVLDEIAFSLHNDIRYRKIILQYVLRKIEDTKGLFRIGCISKKNKIYNGQKKRDKRTNNDLHNSTQKTKNWTTQIPHKTEGDLRCSGRVSSSCSTRSTHCATLDESWTKKELDVYLHVLVSRMKFDRTPHLYIRLMCDQFGIWNVVGVFNWNTFITYKRYTIK
jgi:hypothetical protein